MSRRDTISRKNTSLVNTSTFPGVGIQDEKPRTRIEGESNVFNKS